MFLPKTTLAEEHDLRESPVRHHLQGDVQRIDLGGGGPLGEQRYSLNPWEDHQGHNLHWSFAHLDYSAIDGAGEPGNDFVDSFIKPKKSSARPSPTLLQRLDEVQKTEPRVYYLNKTLTTENMRVGEVGVPHHTMAKLSEREQSHQVGLSPTVPSSLPKAPVSHYQQRLESLFPSNRQTETDILVRTQNILHMLESQTPLTPVRQETVFLSRTSTPSQLPSAQPGLLVPKVDESTLRKHEQSTGYYTRLLKHVETDPRVAKILAPKPSLSTLNSNPPNPSISASLSSKAAVDTLILKDMRQILETQQTPIELQKQQAESVLSFEVKETTDGFVRNHGVDALVQDLDRLRKVYAVRTKIPEDLMTADRLKKALETKEKQRLAHLPIPDISDIIIPVKGYHSEQIVQIGYQNLETLKTDYIQEWLLTPNEVAGYPEAVDLLKEYSQFDREIQKIIQKQANKESVAEDLLRKITKLNQKHQNLEQNANVLDANQTPAVESSTPQQQISPTRISTNQEAPLVAIPSQESPHKQISQRRLSNHSESPELVRQVSPNRITIVPSNSTKKFNLQQPTTDAPTRVEVQPVLTELPSGYVILNNQGPKLLSPFAIAPTRLNHIPKEKFKERKLTNKLIQVENDEGLYQMLESQQRDLPTPEEIKSKEAELNLTPDRIQKLASDYSMPTPTNMVADPALLTRGIKPLTPPNDLDLSQPAEKSTKDDLIPAENPAIPPSKHQESLQQPKQATPTASSGPTQMIPHTDPTATPVPLLPLATIIGPPRPARSPNRITLSTSPRSSDQQADNTDLKPNSN